MQPETFGLILIPVFIFALVCASRMIIQAIKEDELCDSVCDVLDKAGIDYVVEHPVIFSPLPTVIVIHTSYSINRYIITGTKEEILRRMKIDQNIEQPRTKFVL